MNDENLQTKAEEGLFGDDLDSKAYHKVFRGLEALPATRLAETFADRVVSRIEARSRRSERASYVWISLGSLSLLIALAIALSKVNFNADLGVLRYLYEMRGLVVFAILFIGLLQWVDRKLVVRKKDITAS